MLQQGDKAPHFTATDDRGKTVNLSDFEGSPVVLFFYPKNNTPGCTMEACNFRDQHTDLETAGAKVFGVSPDTVASHTRFRDKHGLPFRLLADEDRALAKAYGVWKEKKMFGRTFWGVDRVTFVIDGAGQVAAVIRGVKPAQHADRALAAVKQMPSPA